MLADSLLSTIYTTTLLCKMILQDNFRFTMSWRSEKTCFVMTWNSILFTQFSLNNEEKIGSGSGENWNKLDVKFQMSEIKGNFLCILCVFFPFLLLHPRKELRASDTLLLMHTPMIFISFSVPNELQFFTVLKYVEWISGCFWWESYVNLLW